MVINQEVSTADWSVIEVSGKGPYISFGKIEELMKYLLDKDYPNLPTEDHGHCYYGIRSIYTLLHQLIGHQGCEYKCWQKLLGVE